MGNNNEKYMKVLKKYGLIGNTGAAGNAVPTQTLTKANAAGPLTVNSQTTNPSATGVVPSKRVVDVLQRNGLLTSEFDKVYGLMTQYAQYGPAQVNQFANDLATDAASSYKKGDIKNFSWDDAISMKLFETMLGKELSKTGMFDNEMYALNSLYSYLPQTSYLESLLGQRNASLAESLKKDEADKAAKTRALTTWQNWSDMQNRLGELNEDTAPYFYAYADYLMNGDLSKPFSIDSYDAAWGEMDDDAYFADIDAKKAQFDALDWKTLTTKGAWENDYESATAGLRSDVDKLQKEIDRRKALAEMEAMLRSNPDFDALSAYQDTYTAAEGAARIFGNDAFIQGLDDQQRFINAQTRYADRHLAGEYSGKVKQYLSMGLDMMTPAEIANYNVALSMGPEQAEAYLELLAPELNARRAEVQANYYTTRAGDTLAGAIDSAGTIITKPQGTFNTIWGAISGEYDPNASIYDISRNAGITRSEYGEHLGKLAPFQIFGEEAGTVAYNILMSVGDMLMARGIGGMVGGLSNKAGVAQKVMGWTMASQSGADTYLSDLQNGKDPLYAAMHGIANGAVEMWSESGFIDSLFDDSGKFLTRVAKSATSEGLEEWVSEGGQMAVDLFLSYMAGQENEIQQTYKYYEATLGKDKAAAATLEHYANNFAIAGLSGFVSGGGTSFVTNTATEINNRQVGNEVAQNGDPEALLGIAKQMDPSSNVYQIATEIETSTEKGKKMSLGKLGRLTQEMGKVLGEQYADLTNGVMNDAITERLIELGSDPEAARRNADVIRKIGYGLKVTVQERAGLLWDKYADQVAREVAQGMHTVTKGVTSISKGIEDAKQGVRNAVGGFFNQMENSKAVDENIWSDEQIGGQTGDSILDSQWVDRARVEQFKKSENVAKQSRDFQQALTSRKNVSTAVQEAKKNAAGKVRKGKNGKAVGKETSFHIAYDNGSGVTGEGDLEHIERTEDGKLQLVIKNGDEKVNVDIGDFTQADGEGTATLLESIKYINDNLHDVSAEEANAMLQSYKAAGGDAGRFVESYETLYLRGYSGRTNLDETLPKTDLDGTLANIAVEAGKRQAEADETGRFERAKGRTRNENVTIGWIGEVDSDSQITGLGDPDSLAAAIESMTEAQRNSVNLIIELCREFGTNAGLYASKPGSAVSQSGRYDYDAHSDTFFFDINAGATTDLAYARQIKNGTLGAALPKFVGHEFTHFMQINSAEGYANYARAVKNALNERGQDVAVLMRNRIDQALANGRKLTMQEAEFEVIAHASEYMLQDSKFTDSMDDSLKGRFRQFIKEFGEKIRKAFAKLTGGTVESRALREQIDGVYHYINDLQRLWDVGMTEAGNRPVRGTAATADGGEAKSLFALKDSGGNDISITEKEIQSNKEYVANMQTIVSLNGNPFAKNPDKDFKTMAHEYLGDAGIMAYNDRLGQVNIGMDGIEHLIGTLTSRRSAMIPAIKDVIENGRIIEYEHPHKGYWYDTAVIAGVISLDGTQYYMGVAVRENDDGSTGYYVHDAVFVEKNKSPLPNKSGLVTAGEKAPTLAIILSELANYNREFAESSEKSGMRFESDTIGIVEDLKSPDGNSLFSLRSMQEDYDTYRQMLADNGVSVEEIDALFETIDETMRIVESEREILDFGWNVGRDQRSFNPVKQNSDPLYKVSLDFSSLCRKRLLQQTVQERLEAKYDTVLTKAERVAIRNELMLLREEGKQIEVACALCYVESARLKSPAQIQRFFDDRRAVMVDYFAKKNKEYMQGVNAKADELIVKFGNKPGTKKGELNSFQKKAVENLKQSMYKTYTPSAEEEAIIRTALDLPGESFRSADGLWKLKKEHEEIFDAYTSFVRNATKSKGIEGDEAWWAGDSQNISDKLIAKMNAENGLRSQSWSDFQVIHLLDYMAAVIELSTRNAKMQTYTKVPDFVKLMGDTGAMINLSLIPKGFDGTLNYDPIEGMPIEDALALRRDFPNTAGTICIGITDKHIRMLLANDDIDYVIPYHASSLDKKTRQQMGMKVWEDFTNYQNEKQRDYSNTVKDTKTYHKKPGFSEWFDYDTVAARAREVGANMAMQEAAERYIDLCHRRGLQEKFAQFANEPNYWKLLIDRKMINQVTGEIIQQKAVQPRFDLDRIKGILQGEVDRFKAQNQDFNEAVSHIEQKWENGEVRKAAKSKKVQDAVKAFEDTVVVRNIIESVAEMDQPKSLYAPREVDELTTRDYLAESDDSIAETVEERNALTIYQQRLKEHAEASEAVIAAEEALIGKEGQALADARAALAKARNRQNELYRRLLKVENTEHVRKLTARTQQFVNEDLYGKTSDDVAKMISAQEAEIANLKADLTGLKGAAKTQREADIRQRERMIARLRSQSAQALIRNTEKYQQRLEDLRAHRDLNADITKKERHIKRVVKNLSDRIVSETDYKNVKEPLKPAVHALVKAFVDDFGNMVFYDPSDEAVAGGKESALKARQKLERLKAVYDKLADIDGQEAASYDPEVSAWLAELHTLAESYDALSDIEGSTARLKTKLYIYERLSGIADSIAYMVRTADQIFVNGRRQQIANVAGDVANDLTGKADRKEFAGKLGEIINVLDDSLLKGNMTATTFFESLKNNGLQRLYDDLTEAERISAVRALEGREFIMGAMQRHNYLSWGNMKKPVSFVTEQGREVYMTTGNMLWAYATAKRELSNPLTATHHLSEGGFTYDEKTKRTKEVNASQWKNTHNKLTAKDIVTIENLLTADQKAFADECVEFLSTECADWGNEASMTMFGIKKYNEEYYFPFQVDGDQLYKNSAAGSSSTTDDARLKHTSFTHSVTLRANQPLVMGDFLDIVDNHINQMAIYSAFVVPIENMNRVLNSKVEYADENVTIRSLIASKHGKAAQKYLNDFLKDMNGGPQTDKRGEANGFVRLFKKNAVMGKLSVAVQQCSSIARAFAYINPKYFVSIPKELPYTTWERMMQYSGTTVYKDMGGFNIGLGQQAADWIGRGALEEYNYWKRGKFLLDQKGVAAMKDNWVDFLTALPGVMDKVTWAAIWTATENEQADLHPGMDRSSPEFLEMVGERFDDVIRHSQVYDSVLAKSQNMRSKSGLAKMITAFMAEPTLTVNMAYSAIRSKDGKAIARTTTSLVLNAVLGALAYAAVTAWDKDDDERTGTEKFVTKFAGRLADNINPLTMIPIVSDLWSMVNGYDIERTDMAVFADLFQYGSKFFEKLNEGKEITFRDYENFLGTAVTMTTGVPLKNLMGDFRRLALNLPKTDFSAPPASRVKYGTLDEIMPFRDTSNTAYYERYLSAMRDGDKQEMYDLKDYLMSTKGVKEATITTGVRNAYKAEYQRGGIDKQEAVNFLVVNGLASGDTDEKKRQKAFEYVDSWGEGTDGHSVYNTLRQAFSDGNNAEIQKAWDELEQNGWEKDTIGSYVRTTIIKEMVTSGQITPSKATELLRKWYPYKKDSDNISKPKEWLESK